MRRNVIIILLTVAVSVAWAREYPVSPTGNDPLESTAAKPLPARATTPVNPDASPQARALLNFTHAMYGKKTLSGQMWTPWGIDEIKTVERITGKLPAIRGHDYIHERDNNR